MISPDSRHVPPNADASPTRNILPSTSSHDLHAHLSGRFAVEEKNLHIAETQFSILKVRDTNQLVDAIDPETFAVDERLPYWAELWTSSVELARWCLEEGGVRGKRVIELGCGLGLAGIAAAKAGAIVTFSDYEKDALDFAHYNLLRNTSPGEISSPDMLQLDWRDVPSLEPFDVIIAADVVYERRNFFPLIDVLTKLLADDGLAVFTEPGRTIGEYFFSLLREEGFSVQTLTHSVELDGKNTNVIRAMIRRSRSG